MTDDLTKLSEDELDARELALGKALSSQHKIFADRIVEGASGAKAATDAGYSEKDAKRTATRIIRRKDIATYVHLLREQQRRIASITREWMIRRNIDLAKKAEADRDWVAVRGFNQEITKLLDFYPATKTAGKLEVVGEVKHSGQVNTNYMPAEVMREIFELKDREARNTSVH